MAEVVRHIGLSLGADLCWPLCFEHMIKRLDHPELGVLTLACDSLLDPHRDQNVVMFSVVSADRLRSGMNGAPATLTAT